LKEILRDAKLQPIQGAACPKIPEAAFCFAPACLSTNCKAKKKHSHLLLGPFCLQRRSVLGKKIKEAGRGRMKKYRGLGKYFGEGRKRLFCFEKFIAKFACGKFRKHQGRQRPEARSQSIH
jgi:hypothetical protein